MPMNFLELGDDACWLVFRRIPLQERFLLRQVCQTWKKVIEDGFGRQGKLRLFDSRQALRSHFRELIDASMQDSKLWDATPADTIILYGVHSEEEEPPEPRRRQLILSTFFCRLFSSVNNLLVSFTQEVAVLIDLFTFITALSSSLDHLFVNLRNPDDLFYNYSAYSRASVKVQRRLWPALNSQKVLKCLHLSMDRLDGHLIPKKTPSSSTLEELRIVDQYYSLRDLNEEAISLPKTVRKVSILLPLLYPNWSSAFSEKEFITHLDLCHEYLLFAGTLLELIDELWSFPSLVSIKAPLSSLVALHRVHPIPEAVLATLPDLPLRSITSLHLVDYHQNFFSGHFDDVHYLTSTFRLIAGTFPSVVSITFSSTDIADVDSFIALITPPLTTAYHLQQTLLKVSAHKLSCLAEKMAVFPKRPVFNGDEDDESDDDGDGQCFNRVKNPPSRGGQSSLLLV
ncbi:hypothetical protein TYRP_014113 [Tyrophagus putrescentiae]|nr:hypothetical protein TYRP_014113 [Tyrophagus putrescentiae]